jgi:hypothetical protein
MTIPEQLSGLADAVSRIECEQGAIRTQLDDLEAQLGVIGDALARVLALLEPDSTN